MNIQRLYAPFKKADVAAPNGAERAQAARASKPAEGGDDRVEISAEARAVIAEQAAMQEEVEQARMALRDVPPLTEERVAAILERVKSGYYDRPEVLAEISERLIDSAR